MFQKAKTMVFPRQVFAGHNVIERTGGMCKYLGLKGNALIVTGNKTKKIAGKKVEVLLNNDGYNVHTIEIGAATNENVKKVKKTAKEIKAGFLLGVGGGSKIDVAKLCAKEIGKPFISVPTSASHDGVASPKASIKGGVSVDAVVPLGIIADTYIIAKAPYSMLASGCADVISNLTAVKDWELAHKLRNETFSTSASTLSEMSARVIMENADIIKPGLEESVWIVIKPLIESGASMCIAGSSRPTSGSEHLFSHALDRIAPGKALHGEQCGVGAIMMMYLHDGNWEEIRYALKKIGAPVNAKQLGIKKGDIVKALVMANKIRKDRYTILGDNGLSADAAEKLAKITEVI